MFLLGRQAMLGHDPPTYFRSIVTTCSPRPAKVHAAIVPPVPPPRITRSYSSMFFTAHDETDCVPTFYGYRFLPHFNRVTVGGRAAPLSPIFWTFNFSYLRSRTFLQRKGLNRRRRKSASFYPRGEAAKNFGGFLAKGWRGIC